MPTYEYVCTACGNEFEEIQKISEPPLEVCPKCGKSTAKRQISGGNFILKGGGWYADLYSSSRSSEKTSKGDSGGDKSDKAEKKSETTTEKKDAPKTESSSKPEGSTKSSAAA
jgi:putative FmdB family regulatory protein